MRIPAITGIIDRRILANFRIDPEVMARALPPPFRPKLANGYAIGGICLIRLRSIRPKSLPIPWGIRSENAAHRIAVEWEEDGRLRDGVYIPRRDTDSWLSTLTGGTLFPGIHHHASFKVEEGDGHFSVELTSDDHDTRVLVSGRVADRLPSSSKFPSLAAASGFFESGSLGYSLTRTNGRYHGLELNCKNWRVEPLEVESVQSSYFENESVFPRGSVEFDCALLMRGIQHEWHGRDWAQ